MDDLDSVRLRDRFDYRTLDLEYLRTRELLPDWLRRNKRARGIMNSYVYDFGSSDAPAGHPYHFLEHPRSWTGELGISVIADPDNYARAQVEYAKEDRYRTDPDHPWMAENHYYVVTLSDIRKLWQPLPWSSLRMQAWEMMQYIHWGHLYLGHDQEPFFYPPTRMDSRVYTPKIDEHWKDEYIAQVWAEYYLAKAAERAQQEQYAARWALPERHMAVRHIRRWYKDYQMNEALLADPHSSPAYAFIGHSHWHTRYTSPDAMQADPIERYRRANR
jgi:hypothetical protein